MKTDILRRKKQNKKSGRLQGERLGEEVSLFLSEGEVSTL